MLLNYKPIPTQSETPTYLIKQLQQESGVDSRPQAVNKNPAGQKTSFNKKSPLSIIIEGLDASGKSASANDLLVLFSQLRIQDDSLTNNEHHQRAKTAPNSLDKTNALLMGIMHDISADPDLTNLLQVSWAFRTVAVAGLLHGVNIDLEPILKKSKEFDHRIGLIINPDKQTERLMRRAVEHPEKLTEFDRYVLKNPSFNLDLHHTFQGYLTMADFILIDTSNLTKTEMYERVRQCVLN